MYIGKIIQILYTYKIDMYLHACMLRHSLQGLASTIITPYGHCIIKHKL